jgi:hypothetical protein
MPDIQVDGQTRVSYFPTCANIAAPTVAEIQTAGTYLSDTLIMAGLEGWESSTGEIDATALSSTFDFKLPGRISFTGTALVFKKQSGTDTIFNLLSVPGTNGFIGIRDGSAATTSFATSDKVEVYPVRTATHVMLGRGEGNSLLRYRVPTMISGLPNLKAVVA